jgi:hypothetical protein
MIAKKVEALLNSIMDADIIKFYMLLDLNEEGKKKKYSAHG